MGLNDTYDNLRNQILVLDPLPSVHKAYSMALRVEKQREVQINFAVPNEASAMFVRSSNSNNYPKKQSNNHSPANHQFKGKIDYKIKGQTDRYCNHCNNSGHTKESCFKLTGYPDWYKDYKDKKKPKFNSANMVDADVQDNPLHNIENQDNKDSFNAMVEQFSHFLKNNQNVDLHSANFTHLGDFAGPSH